MSDERFEVLVTEQEQARRRPETSRAKVLLLANPRLRAACLLKKCVKRLPDRPLYVPGFAVRARWWSLGRKQLTAPVQQRGQNQVEFQEEAMIFSIGGRSCQFGRKFRWKRTGRLV